MPDWSRYPSEVMYAVKDGSYLAECDWGFCNRPTYGFAKSKSDASEEWLPICLACSKGDFPEHNDEPFPVDEFISLGDVEDALADIPLRGRTDE